VKPQCDTRKFFFSLLITLLFFVLTSINAFSQTGRPRKVEPDTPPPEPQTMDVIKVDSNLVSVPVIVSDREGRYIPNLTANRFRLYDNDAEQQITYFDAAEEPLNIALLLDTSKSTEGVLDDIKKAAKGFLKELRPQDRAMVVSFDHAVTRLCGLTNDRKVLEKAIKNAKVGEIVGTKLNDAITEITRNDFRSITGRKAIILLSDGRDFGSVVSNDDLLREQSESDAMVYSIYYGSAFGSFRLDRRQFPRRFPDRFPEMLGQPSTTSAGEQRRFPRRKMGAEVLRELSENTSGRFYESDITDLKKTFGLISEELRHQYRLGFYPGEIQRDGSVHQLRVKVDAVDVSVRARQLYRAKKE
jgi:VWFA-related protein